MAAGRQKEANYGMGLLANIRQKQEIDFLEKK